MADTIVLVIFYSRDGETERLAHAAAVGSVQARALIRLRRVPDIDPVKTLERFPEAQESLRRMHREYVPPREVDVVGADALILASSADVDADSAEWSPVVRMLEKVAAEGRLGGKTAAVVPNGASSRSFDALVARLGLNVCTPDAAPADDVSRAVAIGRAVAG
jgi:NAD(P)H dehydrogenase (quinone)